MLCRIESRHLDGGHGIQPAGDGMPHHAIHVALLDQRLRMRVVRDQDETTRIETAFAHRSHLGR